MKELGYDVEFYLWVGLFAPKGTPDTVITTLRDASKKAAADEKFKQAMKNLGQDVAYLDQPEFKAFWDADAKRVEDAVRQIGKVGGSPAPTATPEQALMILRADHVAGGAFIAFGVVVFAISAICRSAACRRPAPACCRSSWPG